MIRITKSKTILSLALLFICCSLSAQYSSTKAYSSPVALEAEKRIDDYLKLLKLGYSEREIFEDLGNVSFLTKNYETAAFWYKKLMDLGGDNTINSSYHERYQYALHKAGMATAMNIPVEKDWVAMIKQDYQAKKNAQEATRASTQMAKYRELDFSSHQNSKALSELYKFKVQGTGNMVSDKDRKEIAPHSYEPPIAVTKDGNTAYFSKPEYVKPKYGIFSKKQLVHKIYKADKIDGEWKSIREVAVAPKYFSAMHPTISDDGKRLFFASNMPGTFGEYDIYVSEIGKDGNVGIAKNLGEKVNSKKNDLYPNLVNGTLLFFASEGHKGHGGMDLYATQVANSDVSLAVNLGSPINSGDDDFAIALQTDKGLGFVTSNRGKTKDDNRQLVFSYYGTDDNTLPDMSEYGFLEIMNTNTRSSYSNTIFED